MTEKITVYYDGACGLCAREIAHYKSVAPASVFEWVDITREPDAFTQHGLRIDDGLRALHALDRSGIFHIGADAFVLIWANLPRWWVLSIVVGLPGIRHFARFVYKRFAAWRFNRLGYGS